MPRALLGAAEAVQEIGQAVEQFPGIAPGQKRLRIDVVRVGPPNHRVAGVRARLWNRARLSRLLAQTLHASSIFRHEGGDLSALHGRVPRATSDRTADEGQILGRIAGSRPLEVDEPGHPGGVEDDVGQDRVPVNERMSQGALEGVIETPQRPSPRIQERDDPRIEQGARVVLAPPGQQRLPLLGGGGQLRRSTGQGRLTGHCAQGQVKAGDLRRERRGELRPPVAGGQDSPRNVGGHHVRDSQGVTWAVWTARDV